MPPIWNGQFPASMNMKKEIFKHFDIIIERFLGDKSKIEEVRTAFSDWKDIRSEVIEHTRV